MRDYYKTLGLDRSASAEDIKRAYRRLASQHHPDKGGDTDRFQEIQQAYATLSDPEQRANYDNPQVRMNHHHAGFDFDNIFSMFGTRFRDHAEHVGSSRMQLWINLRDVAMGGRRQLAISSSLGSGTVEIDIPAGVDDGASVRYARLAPGGGDLVITFRIRPEPGWQRQEQHLICEQHVSIWDLVLGCQLEITGLTGNHISLTVPPGTQPNTMMRVRGHGLRMYRHPQPGDLLVKLLARIPKNISEETLAAIRREHNN